MLLRFFSRTRASWVIAAGCWCALASRAHAAGLEDTVAGTIALGRAAAYVRVHDFLATWQNPANLALIPGADLGGELRLPILHACFDRARDPSILYKQPDPSTGFQGEEGFGNVCNDAFPTPAGNLGFARSFAPGWGFGLGFFTPSAVGSSQWGDDTVVTLPPYFDDEVYPITPTGTESPTRFLLVERKALAGFLMAGLGAQPIPELRIGVSAGLGFAKIRNKSVASVLGGTFVDQEIVNETDVTDWAIPRAVLSAVYQPIEAVELMAQMTYSDDIRAKGTLDLSANGIQGAPRKSCFDADPGPHCRIDDVELHVPYHTLEATLGARYALRRNPRERTLDPLRDEIFDLELDLFWAQTSKVDAYTLQIHDAEPGTPDVPRVEFTSSPQGSGSSPRQSVIIPKEWRDTWGARFGGDYNVIRDRLAVRAGVSYMSRATLRSYMNIDYWPVAKTGLHAGATVAFGDLRLSVAYTHLIYESINVSIGDGNVGENVSVMPEAAQPVNEGYFDAHQNIVSLQANMRF